MISGPQMMILAVACTSVTGVLDGVPDDIAVSPPKRHFSLFYIINRHTHQNKYLVKTFHLALRADCFF